MKSGQGVENSRSCPNEFLTTKPPACGGLHGGIRALNKKIPHNAVLLLSSVLEYDLLLRYLTPSLNDLNKKSPCSPVRRGFISQAMLLGPLTTGGRRISRRSDQHSGLPVPSSRPAQGIVFGEEKNSQR